jgi:hypothetical protein
MLLLAPLLSLMIVALGVKAAAPLIAGMVLVIGISVSPQLALAFRRAQTIPAKEERTDVH